MKTSVALIGFMGTGKTTVGKALAEKLNRQFIELDELIEKKAGKPISDIFKQEGEIAFRELEIEVTRDIANNKNVIIACGGGLVLNKINIDRLSQECIIVYLTASVGVILRRTSNDAGKRPLLAVPDRFQQIKELLKFRRPYYKNSADIIINTSKMSINTVVMRIIEELEDNESFS